MQRRTNIQVSSLIILLSIITITIQFVVYYFIASIYIIWGLSVLISVISCHILLEQTATYEACYNYSLLTLFISLVITVLSYLGKSQSFLPYTTILVGIIFINWLIPSIHCFLRNMLDYGTRFEDYITFYRNHSILFFITYIIILLYGSFVESAFPWIYRGSLEVANILPFEAIAIQIEDYLYGLIPLSDIILYLLSRILVFLPYGFLITLVLRKHARLSRFFALLLLPFLLEVLQYFIIPYRCDIDDIIYAFIGGILGSIFYYICNLIFRAFTGRDFLARESDYPFSNSGLHF